MPIEIIINREPPKELLKVIKENYEPEENIEKVIIDAGDEKIGKNNLAGFFPDTKEIIIDLESCLINKGWMGFGMMFIQRVWFNMLRATFHELGHARQLSADPSLKDMAILTPQLEREADEFATKMIYKWAEAGGTVPKINEMGWAGEELKLAINTWYGNKKLRLKLLEELEALEVNGVAELDTFAADNQKAFGKKEYNDLCEAIDNKDVGIKLGNKRYLDPIGFFSFIIDENKAAQNRASETQK